MVRVSRSTPQDTFSVLTTGNVSQTLDISMNSAISGDLKQHLSFYTVKDSGPVVP